MKSSLHKTKPEGEKVFIQKLNQKGNLTLLYAQLTYNAKAYCM